SASSSSPEPASRTIWPTRPARWASRSIASVRAAHERCPPTLSCRSRGSGPGIPSRRDRHVHAIFRFAPWRWWQAQPFNHLHGAATMIILGILVSIAAIGTMCWLLFNLAIFALPFFIGVNAGTWAYGTGEGWLGAGLVGLLAAG